MTADLPLQIAFPSLFASVSDPSVVLASRFRSDLIVVVDLCFLVQVVYWMVGFSDDFERFIYFLLIVRK